MKKRIASIALSLAMCLTLLPTAAHAEDVSEGGAFDSQPSTGNGAATVTGSNEAVDTTKNTVVPTNEDVEDSSNKGESGNNTVDAWDGTADTSWYTEADANATEYHITTAEQLAGLAQLVNADPGTTNFAGKTFYLENDLDLAGHEWISIGTVLGGTDATYGFCGTFDGQGHVISNLYSHESYIEGADESHNLFRNALFGNVYDGEVKNLGVVDAEIWIDPNDDSAAGKGILVDWMGKSKITNCWTSGSIYSGTKTEKNIGGIVGVTVQGCTISGCYSTATLTGNFTNSGGYYKDPNSLPPDTIGGIVGAQFDGDLTVTDCWFDGKIVVNSIQAAVGGIVGCIATVNNSVGGIVGNADIATKNCMVTTTDMGADKDGNTCWVGYLWDGTVANNYWYDDDKYAATPVDKINANAGTAVSDFKSADVLKGLKDHAGAGINWVAGIKHPTFAWDKRNISADYTEVDKAIAEAEAHKGGRYTNYGDVEAAINAVDRNKSVLEQADVDQMAKNIRDAIAALVEKSNSSSSGGGGSSTPRYAVTVPDKTENGSLSVTPKNAKRGSNVTITATPDKGYEVDDIVAKDAKGNKLTLKDNGDGTYTFTMPASKVTIEATFAEKKAEPIVPEKLFADVSAEEYYYEAVKWASENGVTGGIGENLFGAKLPCTRAQIVTFLWRAAGSPEPKGMSGFVDVSADAYYAKAVAWAVEQGIVSGTSATTFSPDAVCTRAQSVAFLYRAFGTRTDKAAGFSDVSADAYYADAVAWAVENGVASGIGGGLFAPDQDCARGQIVAFLYRAYQNK